MEQQGGGWNPAKMANNKSFCMQQDQGYFGKFQKFKMATQTKTTNAASILQHNVKLQEVKRNTLHQL